MDYGKAIQRSKTAGLSFEEEKVNCCHTVDDIGDRIIILVERCNTAGEFAAQMCGECEMYVRGRKDATDSAYRFGYFSGFVERPECVLPRFLQRQVEFCQSFLISQGARWEASCIRSDCCQFKFRSEKRHDCNRIFRSFTY